MKYWNDPEMLNKMMEKMGPEVMQGGGMPAPPPEATPEVANLLDAAKYVITSILTNTHYRLPAILAYSESKGL